MGLIPLMLFAGILAAVLVRWFIYFAARRSKYRRMYITVGSVAAFFVVLANTQNVLDGFTHVGFGVSVEEANKHLFAFKLPPEAIDVNYRRNFFLGTDHVADFSIDEKSFLAWAAENGWQMERFITRERISNQNQPPVNLPDYVSSFTHSVCPTKSYVDEDFQKTVEIHNGYYCSTIPPHDDAGKIIYYDLDTSRAYVQSNNR